MVTVPAFLLSRLPGFQMRWIWFLTVGAVAVQMVLVLLLLQREFKARLNFGPAPTVAPPPAIDRGLATAGQPAFEGAATATPGKRVDAS